MTGAIRARLAVTALPGIERAVADVASRHRASLRGRAEEADGISLTVDVPGDAYVAFVRALGELGEFTGPSELPTTTDTVEVVLHISH